jgi:LysR substrate binding domain
LALVRPHQPARTADSGWRAVAIRTARPYGELCDALTRARESATGVAGTLRIGLYTTLNTGPHMTEKVDTFATRHPGCEVTFSHTGTTAAISMCCARARSTCSPLACHLNAADVTVGPVLSREERVVVIAGHDPLAGRDSISYDEIADRGLNDIPASPREMMDAFIPPVSPSGQNVKRVVARNNEETIMRVALGEQVHPTVRSFLEHHSHPGVTSVPIHDLPLSETALVWMTDNRSPKIQAFVRAAADEAPSAGWPYLAFAFDRPTLASLPTSHDRNQRRLSRNSRASWRLLLCRLKHRRGGRRRVAAAVSRLLRQVGACGASAGCGWR